MKYKNDTYRKLAKKPKDRMARRLKLKNIPEFSKLSGGSAIELAASKADNPLEFNFNESLLQYRCCNFSLSGYKNRFKRHILAQEEKYNLPPDAVIPNAYNLCAAFQFIITKHLCRRVQRAIQYAHVNELIPENKQTLVVSGGVACNNFIINGLQIVCDVLGYKLVRPPPKLCTDNGIMIAWNGIERWRRGIGIMDNLDEVKIEQTSPLGKNIIEDVISNDLRPKWIQLDALLKANNNENIDLLSKQNVQ